MRFLTISPAEVEVLDVDILVRSGLPLAPEKQTLLGGHLLHWNVLDGEPGGEEVLKIEIWRAVSRSTWEWWSRSYPGSSWHSHQQSPQHQWTQASHPCWRWNPRPCSHSQSCGTWKSLICLISSRGWRIQIQLQVNEYKYLILPRSGLGKVSPEMTSNSSINFSPFLKQNFQFNFFSLKDVQVFSGVPEVLFNILDLGASFS